MTVAMSSTRPALHDGVPSRMRVLTEAPPLPLKTLLEEREIGAPKRLRSSGLGDIYRGCIHLGHSSSRGHMLCNVSFAHNRYMRLSCPPHDVPSSNPRTVARAASRPPGRGRLPPGLLPIAASHDASRKAASLRSRPSSIIAVGALVSQAASPRLRVTSAKLVVVTNSRQKYLSRGAPLFSLPHGVTPES